MVLEQGRTDRARVDAWITRSWQRCLNNGLSPGDKPIFAPVARGDRKDLGERNRALVEAARPVLDHLARTIAGTHYFSLLTDAQGVVVDVHGPVDPGCAAATSIARVGIDLSEQAVGTTAIGAALSELQPVWLHRGEHFFSDNGVYSCAGAPLFGSQGQCVGMLDLTGVNVPERPELRHLVARAACSIENSLTLQSPWCLLLRLSWPGSLMADGPPSESEGLVGLDDDGYVVATNRTARQMLPRPLVMPDTRLHCSDLFALPWSMLFDHARREALPLDVPLWSGLRMQALPRLRAKAVGRRHDAQAATVPLKDLETALIRKAVDEARGNVSEAAQRLGISRATVYRKLGQKARGPGA